MNKIAAFLNLSIKYSLITIRLCVFALICLNQTKAQNMIPDSSFETNKFIPLNFSQINASYSWSKPSIGTSDLFCKCGKKQRKYSLVSIPSNPMGNQFPHSGSCYAGLFAFSHGMYREYLQTPLNKSLEKNKSYQFKMYVSLADYSRATVDQLGVCFLANKANYKSSDVIDNLNPIYLKIENEVRNDTVSWHSLTFTYKANGGETYLIIGSFEINEMQSTKVKAPKEVRSRINQVSERDVYFFIDDVSLIETMDSSINSDTYTLEYEKTDTATVFSLNTPFILKNILFETNEAKLSLLSFTELDKVLDYLKNNEQVCIEILGHTDIIGKESQNLVLSRNRARAVSDYFITKKIDTNRISYSGFGSSKPIATNSSEEGRHQNRRVEFIIKYK